MAIKHVYFGIENLNLSPAQRSTLIAALQGLGTANNSNQPAERNHWRIRLDNDAAFFEAKFDENNIDIAAIKQRLAGIFSVDVATIDHSTQSMSYGLLVTFSRLGTDYLRSIAFGYDGGWPTWGISRQAVNAYLKANTLEWNGAEE